MDDNTRIASVIIGRADREHPADAVLRLELKKAGRISQEEKRDISRAVFAYYRWRGWLNWKEPLPKQIADALELDGEFRENPGSIADEKLRAAIPKWIEEQMEVSAAWLRILQTEPALWLRARQGQGRELAAKLGAARVASPELPDTVIYEGEEDLFRTKEFHTGEFELQDISSQIVGLVCDPQPGETWWDACAGEGGKTAHLSDLMGNKGMIWASDRADWRLTWPSIDSLLTSHRAVRPPSSYASASLSGGFARLRVEPNRRYENCIDPGQPARKSRAE